jgi:hypothetical protein
LRWKIPAPEFFLSFRWLSIHFFLLVFLFQIFLLARWTFLYSLIRILFAGIALLAVAALIKRLIKEKPLVLCLFIIVLLRAPFYFHANGLLTTSDNATEALQCVEMQTEHTAPFFLLGQVKHMGTVKYLWIAFLNDFFGRGYLPFVLFQLVLFIAFLFAIREIFGPSIDGTVLLAFFFVNFAFIETVFDYSLSIRGAPYLDMIFFFVLGALLFDFTFESKGRLFLSYYFVFFSLYIQPLAALFVLSFLASALVFAVKRRRLLKNAVWLATGFLAALFHWIYYLLFEAKPVSSGAWERIGVISLSQISARYLAGFPNNFWQTFKNIFGYEFTYFHGVVTGGKFKIILFYLNAAVIYLSLAVFVAGLIIVLTRILRLIRKKVGLQTGDWTFLFYFFLLGCILVKIFIFYPPHQEPRHNFDLVFLIIVSYLLVFSRLFRGTGIRSWKTVVVIILLLAMSIPHGYYFWRNARHKDASYAELMSALSKNRVKYLATDFTIAYCVYYFSQRKILVSDSIGPFTVTNFYPEMRALVDKIPQDQKAYLFFSESYPARPWHKRATEVIKVRILDRLKKAGVAVRIVKLKDYTLIVPSPLEGPP